MRRTHSLLRDSATICILLFTLMQAAYAGQAVHKLNMTRSQFDALQASNAIAGRKLMDIDIRWTGSEQRFNAIWHATTATINTLIQGTPSDWSNFIAAMAPKNGRYLDVEVGYFGGAKRYSAIFYEDGDNYSYALRTTNDDAAFQDYLKQYLNDGLSIIDFEAYTDNNGNTKFAGVWVGDPNQPKTTLYYGLKWDEVGDLINPRIGRVIDLEYYYSSIHGERRWAMIFAADSGGEQFQRRGDSATQIGNWDTAFSDNDTDMIDIEAYKINGIVYYAALWGDTYKSLHEVARIQPDSDPQSIPPAISTLINQFEAQPGPAAIGLYAKNVRTNQSIAYTENEPFYLASTAKIPIHIKYWREIQNNHLDGTTTIPYTNSSSSRAPWYTDNRLSGLGINEFGQSFSLLQYDRFMMSVSDNSATSLLMDDPGIGLTRDGYDINEWLSDIDGVGQGWGLVTSIQDVDRNIMWQGQVNLFPSEPSYFRAPPWALETYFRPVDCDNDSVKEYDCWGDLQNYYGVNGLDKLPKSDYEQGRYRYFAQGLNTATPKATTLLLEKLREGKLLDANNTQKAISSMTERSPIDNYNNPLSWPPYIDVWAKGGIKGTTAVTFANSNLRAISDAGIIDLGPDSIVLSILTEWNNNNTVRATYTTPISLLLLKALAADLEACTNPGFVGASLLSTGQKFHYACRIQNSGGGDAGMFKVNFYASSDERFTTQDFLIGSTLVNNLPGGVSTPVTLDTGLPSIPDGEYFIGWVVDPIDGDVNPKCSASGFPGGDRFGSVGEYDECNNFGYDPVNKLTVDSTPPVLDIQNAPASVNDTDNYPVLFQFSEDVSGFTISDITIFNGSATQLTRVNASTYYTIITPSGAGDIIVDVGRNAAMDSAKNPSAAVQAITRFDTTPPEVIIPDAADFITYPFTQTLTLQFSESVKGFTIEDINVVNGVAHNLILRASNRYTVQISPTNGDIVVSIPTAAFQDDAGNSNTSGTEVTIIFNDAPLFTSPTNYTVGNRATIVGQITAIDDEDDPIELSIFGGPDQAVFSMNSGGLLRFIDPVDFDKPQDQNGDNTYSVGIEAFDGNTSSYQWLSIDVDINAGSGAPCTLFTIPFTIKTDEHMTPVTEQKTAIFCL